MKKLIGLLAALVVVLALAVVLGVLYVDGLARSGIERGGTYALGVPTTLDKADVGFVSGEFGMSGLTVANPRGFEGPHFLALGDGRVAVSLGTLREELVELPTLELTGLDVVLDKRDGKSNYQVILDNLKRFESDEPADDTTEEPGGKRYVIRTVNVRDVTVHVTLLPVGGELTKLDVPIESITLTDVGSDADGGMLLSQVTGVLVKAVFAAIVQKTGGVIPDDVLGSLQSGLAQLQSLEELGVDVTADIRKEVAVIGEQAAGAVEDLGKEAEKALEGLGGLLGGDKKDDEKDDG